MNAAMIGGLVRHLLTTFGGILVANGVTDENTINAIAGGLAALAGLVWSLWEKKEA